MCEGPDLPGARAYQLRHAFRSSRLAPSNCRMKSEPKTRLGVWKPGFASPAMTRRAISNASLSRQHIALACGHMRTRSLTLGIGDDAHQYPAAGSQNLIAGPLRHAGNQPGAPVA